MALQAGSAYSSYALDLRPLAASITAAKRQLSDFRTFADKTLGGASPSSAGGASGGRSSGGAGGGARNAEDEALRLAQARARLAQATGDGAGAERILSTALASSTGASERATIAVQTQAARLKGASTYATQFGDALQSSLLSIVGPAAAAGAAIAAVSQAGELIKLGAQAEQAGQRFDGLAASAGTTGDALLKAMRAASGGTINDLNLQLAANRANLLGVADSAGELSTLMRIAAARAQDMGISTTQAFNDLVTGLGRGSALILDNLGITISVTEANKAYAAQLGKTASALTEAEQKQALINAVLTQGTASLEATGGAAETTATKLERATAAIDNAKSSLGQFLALKAGPFADDLAKVANALTGIGSVAEGAKAGLDFSTRIGPIATINSLLGSVINKAGQLSGLKSQIDLSTPFRASAASIGALVGGLTSGQGVMLSFDAAGRAVISTMNGQASATQGAAGAARESAAVHAHLAEEHGVNAVAADADAAAAAHLASEHQVGAVAADNAARMTAQSAINSQIDAAAKQEQAAQTELATAKANEAALAFMTLHPNISASGAASLLAASNIDPLIQQLILARIRANEAANALASFNIQAGAKGQGVISQNAADELKQDQIRGRAQARTATATKNYNDLLDAQHDRVNLVGTAQERVTQAENDLAAARKRYGVNSDEAYRAETALLQARQRGAREGSKGGAAKVSEAAKFNNQIIDNETKTQQKLDDLARDHYTNQLRIQADFERKSLEQQQANEIDKRRSRASFYKTLNVDNRELSQQVRNELSAAYEAAYAKAQELAAAGNAQQANEYLKLKQSQLEAEAQFQRDLAEAKKAGDKAAVEALIKARELERQAEAEEEKQLLEGGDANVNARNEQLAEEQRRFEDAQQGVVDSSDRATDKIVTNADRRGVALDAENAKLREQANLYNQMGGGAPLPPGATAPPPTTAGAAGGVPGAAAAGGEVWRVFDQGVVDAINSQTEALGSRLDATNGKLDVLIGRVAGVESAVRGLGSRALA